MASLFKSVKDQPHVKAAFLALHGNAAGLAAGLAFLAGIWPAVPKTADEMNAKGLVKFVKKTWLPLLTGGSALIQSVTKKSGAKPAGKGIESFTDVSALISGLSAVANAIDSAKFIVVYVQDSLKKNNTLEGLLKQLKKDFVTWPPAEVPLRIIALAANSYLAIAFVLPLLPLGK